MLLSPFISPSPSCSPPLSVSLFSMSASPLLLCEQINQTHLSRFHVFLFLTDLLVLIRSRFILFIRTDSNVFLFMAAFDTGSDCSLAMFWGGSWSYFAPFQFGFPVWVLTAELLLGEPSEVCERGAARSSLAARRGRQNPLWPTGAGRFAFRLGWVTSWRQFCLLRALRARAPG